MKINLDYLYYATRTLTLPAFIIFLILWIIYGYDSTLETIILNIYGVGVHLSTYATFFISIYILTINIQTGNKLSFKKLLSYMKYDLMNSLSFTESREYYIYYKVKPIYGVIYAISVSVFASFLFEIIYVFLLNYYHFSSLTWPLLYNQGIFYRNFLLLIFSLIEAILIIITLPKNLESKFSLNRKTFYLGLIFVLSWLIWISYPVNNSEIEDIESLDLDINSTWVLPRQKFFPQTVNIYFNSSINEVYEQKNLHHFYKEDNNIHTINIVVKTLTYILVCYTFTVRIEYKE